MTTRPLGSGEKRLSRCAAREADERGSRFTRQDPPNFDGIGRFRYVPYSLLDATGGGKYAEVQWEFGSATRPVSSKYRSRENIFSRPVLSHFRLLVSILHVASSPGPIEPSEYSATDEHPKAKSLLLHGLHCTQNCIPPGTGRCGPTFHCSFPSPVNATNQEAPRSRAANRMNWPLVWTLVSTTSGGWPCRWLFCNMSLVLWSGRLC